VLSRFFIDRPTFATVLSLAITLAGGLALLTLPLARQAVPPAGTPNGEAAPRPGGKAGNPFAVPSNRGGRCSGQAGE
jgi:multidrug efflux pump